MGEFLWRLVYALEFEFSMNRLGKKKKKKYILTKEKFDKIYDCHLKSQTIPV